MQLATGVADSFKGFGKGRVGEEVAVSDAAADPGQVLVDDTPDLAVAVAKALAGVGCGVVATLEPGAGLLAAAVRHKPDVILVDVKRPGDVVFDQLQAIQREAPCPVVMFAEDENGETITRAVEAGISAYVVYGWQTRRIRPVLEVAIARFRQYRALAQELENTRAQLQERKLIDRAKGLLMEQRRLTEDEAYRHLRKQAMNQNKRLVEVARFLLGTA